MPTSCGFGTRFWWLDSTVKHFRGSKVLDGAGRNRRFWLVVDREFDRSRQLYRHKVVPA